MDGVKAGDQGKGTRPILTGMNKLLVWSLVYILAVTLPLLYAREGVIDPFMFLHLATVEQVRQTGCMSTGLIHDPLYTPAFTSIMVSLANTLGISTWRLQFLPIHGLLMPLVYYVLCRRLTSSPALSALAVLAMMVGVSFGSAFYGTWIHGWGFVLFPLFVLLYLKIQERRDWRYFTLLFLVFVTTFLYSYTVNIWMVSFAFLVNIPQFTRRRNVRLRSTLPLALSFAIITLFFNRVMYDLFLATKRFASMESPYNFLAKYFPSVIAQSANEYQYAVTNLWFALASSVFLILLIGSVFVGMLWLLKGPNRRPFLTTARGTTVIALLLTSMVDFAVYAISGTITPRFMIFVFPAVLVAILVAKSRVNKTERFDVPESRENRVIQDATATRPFRHVRPQCQFGLTLMVILVLVASLTASLRWSQVDVISSPAFHSEYEPAGHWLLAHSPEPAYVSDLLVGYKVRYDLAQKGVVAAFFPLNLTVYSSIVAHGDSSEFPPYILLGWDLKRLDASYWAQFEPWKVHEDAIVSNGDFNLVFADDSIWILAKRDY
ncbi:MAG: hypothetical protein V3V21_06700 [Thermoplasmata archaeon]